MKAWLQRRYVRRAAVIDGRDGINRIDQRIEELLGPALTSGPDVIPASAEMDRLQQEIYDTTAQAAAHAVTAPQIALLLFFEIICSAVALSLLNIEQMTWFALAAGVISFRTIITAIVAHKRAAVGHPAPRPGLLLRTFLALESLALISMSLLGSTPAIFPFIFSSASCLVGLFIAESFLPEQALRAKHLKIVRERRRALQKTKRVLAQAINASRKHEAYDHLTARLRAIYEIEYTLTRARLNPLDRPS